MKSIALFVLLFTAASAQADKHWWHDGGRHHEPHEHRVHDKSYKHKSEKKRHKEKSQKQDHRHSYGHSNRHYDDHNGPRHDGHRTHRYGHQHGKGYRDGYHDGHRKSHQKAHRWEHIQGFRGRSGREVTRYIGVNNRVRALSIEGTKRAMYIREAYALMGNGRWVRVHGLEGYVSRGERLRHRLRNPRFVQKVVLEVEPARYKRGYAQLLVRPA